MNQFNDALIKAILIRWKRGERPIESKDVYGDLVAQGIEVPEGTMSEAFRVLDQQGWVVFFYPPYQADVGEHGHAAVTWISDQWLR